MNRTAAELAEYLGAKLQGEGSLAITGVAGPENATATDLIYLDAPKFAARIENSAAMCVLAPPNTRAAGKTILEVPDPKFAFAKAAAWLSPHAAPSSCHPPNCDRLTHSEARKKCFHRPLRRDRRGS